MPRRRFTREFKLSAVKLVQEQGYTTGEAAKSLGVDPATIRNWLAKFPATGEAGTATTDGALREQVRKLAGKKPTPTAAIIDSQSVRTAKGGWERGYDAAKKVTGRKRHLVVDTLGLVLAVVVHGGHWQDHDGASFVLLRMQKQFHRLKVIFGDSAYARNHLPEWVAETLGWVLQTVLRPVGVPGFVVLPKRWIIERTFAWINRCRRNAKDYERKPENGEAMIHLTMIALMSKRLANHHP